MKPLILCSCGADCSFEQEGEPCYGKVDVIEEVYDEDETDYWWIHSCEGHRDVNQGGKYHQVPEHE